MGTIVRTAAASSAVDAVAILDGCCDVYAPITTFASCGVNLRATYIQSPRALEEFKEDGASIFALDISGTTSLFSMGPLPKKTIWLLGSEASGLSEKALGESTQQIRIPMARGIDSLSVAHTAALVSFFPQFVHKQ
jgi:tRNA G18 (ribose-2'-O)-methylase SpoU